MPGEVIISEVVSTNLGGGPNAGRDDRGEWDDWLELENVSGHDVDLAGLWVSDSFLRPDRHRLPDGEPIVLKADERIMLFADGEAHQGPRHLPFVISKGGEALMIATSGGIELDRIEVPQLRAGQSYALIDGAWQICESPSPARDNDCTVKPVLPPTYKAFTWPSPWPPLPDAPVILRRVSRRSIEIENRGDAIDLSSVSLSTGAVALPTPAPTSPLPNAVGMSGRLEANATVAIDVDLDASAGVVLVGPDGALWDRLVFEALGPEDVLVRGEDAIFRAASPIVREIAPPFLRALRAPEDIALLADHDAERTSDARSVKFVVDRLNGNAVYFMDSVRWPLHFDWTWELIDGRPAFDLCDPADKARHDVEWGRFSQVNYFSTTARRYYLGTLVHYADSDLYTIEFASGDLILPDQIRDAFFIVASKFFAPERLFFRPTTASFEERVSELDGYLPIVPPDAPFKGTRFVPLNPGVAYGVLQVVAEEGDEDLLSFQSIPIFSRIPNDVPLVGGTITEELQTPLAHVNVLAQNRGTPNMALIDASSDPRIAPFVDQLVRLEVTGTDFSIRVATSSEAEAFWAEKFGSRPVFVPQLDTSVRSVVSLDGASIGDTPRIGAKAAQYAELMNMDFAQWSGGRFGACASAGGTDGGLPIPRPAFAVPFARYVEHLERHGIDTEIQALLENEDVLANPAERRAALKAIRDRIEDSPIDPDFVEALETLVEARFGLDRVRFRSSTNVEDLVGFNGAGLYTSKSAQARSTVRPIAEALARVWASTYSFRAFEERRLFNVDETKVAMAVLIHRGFPGEEANGVAITKNVVDPSRFGYYVNAQVGEISIVNPEGDFVPEQLLYKAFVPPEVTVLARSSVTAGMPVMSEDEVFRLACVIGAAHNRFRDHYADVIDPKDFALDVEFKIDGPNRQVWIKQARPYIGTAIVETSCE